jgi:hypothetical protein
MQKQKPPEKQPQGKPSPAQDNYDIFVAQGIKLASQAADRLKGKASIDVLGNTLYEIVNKIDDEGRKHGITFDISILLHGSNEILGQLIDMSGVQINEEQIKAVIGTAVGKYLQNAIKTGKMTQEQIIQLAQQAQQSMPQGQQPGQTGQMPQGQMPAKGLIGQAQQGV